MRKPGERKINQEAFSSSGCISSRRVRKTKLHTVSLNTSFYKLDLNTVVRTERSRAAGAQNNFNGTNNKLSDKSTFSSPVLESDAPPSPRGCSRFSKLPLTPYFYCSSSKPNLIKYKTKLKVKCAKWDNRVWRFYQTRCQDEGQLGFSSTEDSDVSSAQTSNLFCLAFLLLFF